MTRLLLALGLAGAPLLAGADEAAAPRFAFTAEQLARLAESPDPELRCRAPSGRPYWDVGLEAVEACHEAIVRMRPALKLPEPLDHYALQMAGVTREGAARIEVRGFCSGWWAAEPGRIAELEAAPIRVVDGGSCFFDASCSPDGSSARIRFHDAR